MTEQDLWRYWRHRLDGFWERVEAHYPLGFPDVYGVYNGIGQYLELKIGPARPTLLRSTQVVWLQRWWQAGGTAYIMVGNTVKVEFFKDTSLLLPVVPPFWR